MKLVFEAYVDRSNDAFIVLVERYATVAGISNLHYIERRTNHL